METTISLAPAAGAGIGKLLADSLLADPEFVPLMKEAAMGGLKAERSFWDKNSGGIISEPDHRVQIQALALLLAHMEGEPVKRIIHQHLGGDGQIDLGAALRDSPALQAAIERQLENARFKDRNRGGKTPPKTAEVVIDE